MVARALAPLPWLAWPGVAGCGAASPLDTDAPPVLDGGSVDALATPAEHDARSDTGDASFAPPPDGCVADLCPPELTATGIAFQAVQGVPFGSDLGHVTDTRADAGIAALTVVIDWGDGSVSTSGTIAGDQGTFTVQGSHTYMAAGAFAVSFTVTDTDTRATATASLAASVTIARTVVELTVPGQYVADLAAGPDGNMWFTEYFANRIGRVTRAGELTEFAIPTASSKPFGIAAGSDGNLRFTETGTGAIGRLTPAGVFTEFPLPADVSALGSPAAIAAGADGAMWFTMPEGIGRIARTGAVTFVSLPMPGPNAAASPQDITAGPDNNVWFTSYGGLGRIAPDGTLTQLGGGFGGSIAAGLDAHLWYTVITGSYPTGVDRVSTTGASAAGCCTLPTAFGPSDLAGGPDGNMWVCGEVRNPDGSFSGQILRITPAGAATVAATLPDSTPQIIAFDPNGDLWFFDNKSYFLGFLAP
jgi:virginiamycin B lyase